MPQQKATKVRAVKQPQDHKRKDAPALYEFEWEGLTYHLPPPDAAVEKVSGKALRDAYMDGEQGQMRLGFIMLEHVEAEPGTLDALYAMPAPMMLDHIQKWMELRADDEAATVGESLRSLS